MANIQDIYTWAAAVSSWANSWPTFLELAPRVAAHDSACNKLKWHYKRQAHNTFLALCGMGATQSWVTELCHCLTQVCRKRRLEKGWTNGTSVTRSSSRCGGFVSGSHIFFIVNETLKQNLQSCESLNDLKCVDGTINPIQFNTFTFLFRVFNNYKGILCLLPLKQCVTMGAEWSN